MVMLGKIRRMFYRDGVSLSEIARRTSLSRNTVKKWLKTPEGAEPQYRRKAVSKLLTPFVEKLECALEADLRRVKRERRTAKKLFEEIKAEGFTGSYCRVSEFVRAWRGKGLPVRAYVPLKFELGEAYQFDWSEESLVIGGIYRKIQVAHLKLCASRAFVLIAYPSQGHEMLFDAHTRSFAALGGIPRRGIYDNMKTAVDKVKKGKGRMVNPRFAAMASHYLVDTDFCTVAAGWEKGIVEKNVQDSRRRIWQEASKRRFGSFMELNLWVMERCRSLWKEIRHPEYDGMTVSEVLEQEREHLMPMLPPFDGYVESLNRVSSTSLVAVARNRYSVPCEYVGQRVSTRLYPEHIDIVCGDQVVASHRRLSDRGQVVYDWQHYIPLVERKPGALRNGAPFADMPAPLLALQQGLLKREGGDRVMSRVLSAIPVHGLEAVLVAVELVLESGIISAEHVLNIIARIQQPPAPETVVTALALRESPIADTSRYDSLRNLEVNHV